jgi:hypothetical protein
MRAPHIAEGGERCERLASTARAELSAFHGGQFRLVFNRPPAGVSYPHIGNSERPGTYSYDLGCHRCEPVANEAGERLDIESVRQYQRLWTTPRPGSVEHFE